MVVSGLVTTSGSATVTTGTVWSTQMHELIRNPQTPGNAALPLRSEPFYRRKNQPGEAQSHETYV